MTNRALKQQARVRTNTIRESICSVTVEPVRFATLWASYPSGHPYVDARTGKPPKGYENQCAIKVSMSIHGAGVAMKSFKGATIKVRDLPAAIGATQLANWLKLQPFCGLPKGPEDITGKHWQDEIKGRTGIIYFENYWRRAGETRAASGDHIDLWNLGRLTPSAANNARRLGLASIQWLPGLLATFNFSDLGNSTKILFWEVK